MGRTIKNQKKKTIGLIVFIVSLVLLSGSISLFQWNNTKAATSENADIRFIFTTDLHGRLTTTNYETGESFNTGSLSKAYTLIKNARAEKKSTNSFTFDIGDVLYDYTTETIYETDKEAIQPIYQAMKAIGYDAITLGNHEFDYGYDYIMEQMRESGLRDICVVSNLTNTRTNRPAFDENMIISRKVTTNSGNTATINVGVIGETIPVLSTKRENYTGLLKTEDIVANVQKEAAELKEEGADIIVVLAHSGFGTENPTELSKDVSYALTKIDDVDVVLCGHEHHMFPSKSVDSASYYKLSGVDKESGLVNDKNLVMANDKGQSIGVVDLKVEISSTGKAIIARSSEVRQVTSSTAVDNTINAMFSKWAPVFNAAIQNIVGDLSDGQTLNNYLGIVQDTNTIQLLNNAKINYALKYIDTKGTKYLDYPIIAASIHSMDGQLSSGDYANITGQITEANLSCIAPYNKYLFLYEITGKQLKEWLEWTASAYQNTSASVTWTDETMNSIMKSSGVPSLVSEKWLDEWSSFYIFDGINYTINPTVDPRYDYSGTLINNTNRISSVTYNGKPVTDDMKFILSTESLTNAKIQVLNDIKNQAVYKGINKTITILADYVKQLNNLGKITPVADNNWRISLPSNCDFIIKASDKADSYMGQYQWKYSLLNNVSGYNYYKVHFNGNIFDNDGPNLVLASSNEKETNKNIKVGVSASDESGLKMLKYAYGDYDKDNDWNSATDLFYYFTATANGTYTVYAEDNKGNYTIKKIKINNMNSDILEAPTVNSYSNRTTKITGTAEPNATIYFKTTNKEYESTVDSSGAFSYSLPSQSAGSVVSVYVKDSTGRLSETTTVTVKRTGPNQPSVSEIKNNLTQITGKTNDLSSEVSTVFAVADKKVYVSKSGGAQAYQKCDKYVSSYDIVETDVIISKNGTFTIDTDGIIANSLVTIYSYDHAGRLSKANLSRVTDAGPNPPVINTVCNAQNKVYGKVYDKAGTLYNITLYVGNQAYQTITDVSGKFSVLVGKMAAGESLRVYATDQVDGVTRKSATISRTVKDVTNYVITDDAEAGINLDEITDKSAEISGSCNTENAIILINIGDQFYEVTCDEYWNFSLPLDAALPTGTQVNAVIINEYSDKIVAASTSVILGLPDQPQLINAAVYNTTKKIQVLSYEKLKIKVKVGDAEYSTDKCIYDSALEGYIYDIAIKSVNSDTEMSIYATNTAGDSDKLKLIVAQKAPDSPDVKPVYANTTVIKGTVNLILEGNEEGLFIPTVADTGTEVFAKIKNVIYSAVIQDDGTFEIKIPKQKVKTSVFIWGSNTQGKGPVEIIKVLKAK